MPPTATHTPSNHADPTRSRPFPPGWRGALLRGIDAVVAFATLRDAELPDAARAPRPTASAQTPPHPHRKALRRPTRPRRPGAVRAPRQACVTPLVPRHPRRPARAAGRHG
jgi:hypothetical protein